ncbi:MAG: cytochrome P450 [Gammaproteobacteria bacterium]
MKVFQPALDPRYADDPFLYYAGLHDGPDIFYSPVDLYGRPPGNWVCTRAEQYRHVLQNSDLFTNDMSDRGNPWRRLVPLELDPPEHGKYRALIAPIFSPRAIDELDAHVREVANGLIDGFIARGACEFNADFGLRFPVTVFMRLMGLPAAETDRFLDWEHRILHGSDNDDRLLAGREIAAYLDGLIAERRRTPRDDLVTLLVNAQVDDHPISDEMVQDMCFLLFLAGLDTVSLMLVSIFRYLAQRPAHRRRLVAQPQLVPNAAEELIRLFALGGSARKARVDTEILGVKIARGDWINCPNICASRDPREFANPNEADFDRPQSGHYAFAVGPHRCAGSNLARREVRISLETWLARIPEFRIPDATHIEGHAYGNMGFVSLPLQW